MKKITYIITVLLCATIYMSCTKDEAYDLNRPAAPGALTATKGDTSVFLKWDKVQNAPYYVLVRGLSVIADSLTTESYEDPYAPDTMVEYRIYAMNAQGWRSSAYANDSGYSGLPQGILPRAPISITASTENNEGCVLEWKGGRFAKSFSIYRDEELIASNVVNSTFTDYKASVTAPAVYRVFSENANGTSLTAAEATGKKAYYFLDSYEDLAVGTVIEPWTFRAERIAYYTEGNPEITTAAVLEGAHALLINRGKIQLLCDWGGSLKKGYYKIALTIKKATGGSWMIPSVNGAGGGAERLGDAKEWTHYEYTTSLIDAGVKFDLKVEPDTDSPTYIDNFGIEYISPKALGE